MSEDFRILENSSTEVSETIEKRTENIVGFFKKKTTWIFYFVLALIVGMATYIRTRNIDGLKSIVDGSWVLGPDLDPYLFLRWAQYIVENGRLMEVDYMRYLPLGYNTAGELRLLPYLIAWFYKVLSVFSSEVTVTYAAIIFPVFMFILTVIAFFFLVREVFWYNFKDKVYPNIIALIACFFLSVIPVLLPRTIAGIPEKESAAFFFMFMVLYFFLLAWRKVDFKWKMGYAILAGIFTAGMAMTWGAYGYLFLIIGLATLIGFLIGQVNWKRFCVYIVWMLSAFVLMMPFSTKFTIARILKSTWIGPALLVLLIMIVYFAIYKTKLKELKIFNSTFLRKVPKQAISLVIGILGAVILATIIFGFEFISGQFSTLFTSLVKPATSRLIQTVAENRQPYFGEWAGSFGPIVQGIPLFFWLFFISSIYLFFNLLKKLKMNERWMLTIGYLIFLSAIVFSRYAGDSVLNGENFTSLIIYFGGIILFGVMLIYYYIQIYQRNGFNELKRINFGNIMIFCFFILAIVSARGLIRLVMVLVPPTSALVSYFIVSIVKNTLKPSVNKDDVMKVIGWLVVAIVLIATVYSGFYFYNLSVAQAKSFYPSQYNWQWQRAMDWVRTNTPEDAVFGHWWDYGYWLQSIGERATFVDGGNSISYWNHLNGRHVLTTPDDRTALEFLYAHNTTHYLIDSTDLGKYGAYSKIGSDATHDRISYLPIISVSEQESRETANGMLYVYNMGFGIDEDIVADNGGEQRIFMKENSFIGGAMIEVKDGEYQQPVIVLINQNDPANPTNVAIRYLYVNGELMDFGDGLKSGMFLFDEVRPVGEGISIVENGKGVYLSVRTVNSFFARKYLFGEEGNFKLVHNEPNYIISEFRNQGASIDDFIYLQGQFLGPIKIWEIDYPEGVVFNEEFISREYPDELKFG